MNFEDLLLIGGLLIALTIMGASHVHARPLTAKSPAARSAAAAPAGQRS